MQQRPVPEEILEHETEQGVTLDRSMFLASLRSAPRGSSPRLGGCTYEHLKILLDDTDTTELLMSVCNTLAQGKIPANIKSALLGARLTALSKPLGGVRGIAIGSTIRRLVARTLAKQFVDEFEAECAPFQDAPSTRAGTDCVGHVARSHGRRPQSYNPQRRRDRSVRSRSAIGDVGQTGVNAGCEVVASILACRAPNLRVTNGSTINEVHTW